MKKITAEDIKKEIADGMRLDADGYRYLLKKLEPVQRSLEAAAAKEKEKRAIRMAALSQYETEQDIQDAYGYALITDDERRQLLDALESGEKYVEETRTKTTVALHLLKEFIAQLNRQAGSLEFELLPPEEQAKRRAETEEIQERAAARRAARKEAQLQGREDEEK